MQQFDIAIVGAGFAGLNLAHATAAQGLDVAVVDKRTTCPDIFRAEKIEPDQASVMRDLGTLQFRSPKCEPIGKTLRISGDSVSEVDTVEQYGISYSDTINSLRDNLPSQVTCIHETASEIVPGDVARIVLSNGEEVVARLVVLACGDYNKLIGAIGIPRQQHDDLVSLSFGFDIRRQDGSDFDFNGLNYFLPDMPNGVQYLTVFPIGSRMRVNLFTRMRRSDPLATSLRQDTLATLNKLFPDLPGYLGDVVLDSRVQVMPTTYYRLEEQVLPAVVVVGDAFQSVSPATGSGLSKVLIDVQTLSEDFIPRWRNQRVISADDVAAYYRNRCKVDSDRNSLKSWFYEDYGSQERPPLLTRVRRFVQLSLRFGSP